MILQIKKIVSEYNHLLPCKFFVVVVGDSTLTEPFSEYCVPNRYFPEEMLYSKENIIMLKTTINVQKSIPQLLRPGVWENMVI